MDVAEILSDRIVRIGCSILIVLATMGVTILVTSRPAETDHDGTSCKIAERALEDAYIRMRRICNDRGHESDWK
jgi:hypothetical protein